MGVGSWRRNNGLDLKWRMCAPESATMRRLSPAEQGLEDRGDGIVAALGREGDVMTTVELASTGEPKAALPPVLHGTMVPEVAGTAGDFYRCPKTDVAQHPISRRYVNPRSSWLEASGMLDVCDRHPAMIRGFQQGNYHVNTCLPCASRNSRAGPPSPRCRTEIATARGPADTDLRPLARPPAS